MGRWNQISVWDVNPYPESNGSLECLECSRRRRGEEGRDTQPMKEKTSCSPPPPPTGAAHPPLQGTHTQFWEPTPGHFWPSNLASKANLDKNTEIKNFCLLSPWPGLYYVWCYLISFRPKAHGAMLRTGPSTQLPSRNPWLTRSPYRHFRLPSTSWARAGCWGLGGSGWKLRSPDFFTQYLSFLLWKTDRASVRTWNGQGPAKSWCAVPAPIPVPRRPAWEEAASLTRSGYLW